MTTMRTLGEPDAPTRRLRGRVVDASGAAVTDAVVLAGHDVGLHWATLSADTGAAVDGDGAFDLAVPLTEVTAIALSPRGWSASAFVAAGATAGHYQLATGQSQMMGGGSSALVEQLVDVVAGRTTELAIELPAGNLLVVEVPIPDGSDGTASVTVLPGHVTVTADEAEAAARAGAGSFQLVGGSSLNTPLEFHDRAPGDYTVCAKVELQIPPQHGFRCQPVTLTAAVPILELTIEVPLLDAE